MSDANLDSSSNDYVLVTPNDAENSLYELQLSNLPQSLNEKDLHLIFSEYELLNAEIFRDSAG
ncbi:hypothetical protein HK099_008040, partial [Clydaea vesicula]